MNIENTVINFHVIKNSDWLEDILKLIQKHFSVVSLKELEAYYYHGLSLKNACHLTVDDGDMTVYTNLLPVIKKLKIPFSIYVSPDIVKTGKNFWFQEISGYDLKSLLQFYAVKKNESIEFKNGKQVFAILKSLPINEINSLIEEYKILHGIANKERMGMNLDQLLELKDTGLVEIGAHTFNHPILKNESDEVAKFEIQGCIQELSDLIQEKVTSFAYPNGIPGLDYGDREIRLLKDCGIRLAFTTENERFSKLGNPLEIPRSGMSKGNKQMLLTKLVFGGMWDQMRGLFNQKQEEELRKRILKERG